MTDSVTLKAAFATYPHTKAIKDGTVSSPRIRFVFEEMPVIHRAFRRMVRTGDFDISEMALTTLAQAVAFDKPIAGLPVVVMRGFHHAATVVPKDSRLAAPADLHGKCVGVRAFSQTTGIWVRGTECVNDFETAWFGIYTRFSGLTVGGLIHTSVGLSGGIGVLFTKRCGLSRNAWLRVSRRAA